MSNKISMLTVCALALCASAAPGNGAAPHGRSSDNLAGSWQGHVQFSSGAFAQVKDLDFMYVFGADGTMLESANYDSAPPVPPAYGVWRKLSARHYEAKYRFYLSRAVTSAEELIKGGGWAPDGYGVLTQSITLAADGNSFESTIMLTLFDRDGKALGDGGAATASGQRMRF